MRINNLSPLWLVIPAAVLSVAGLAGWVLL